MSRRLTILVALAAATAARPALAQPAAEARPLTFDQAIALAATESPDVAVAAKSIDAADSHATSTRRLRLPALSVDSNLLYWDRSLEFEISGGMEPPPGTEIPTVTVRERLTSATTATVAVPLSAQFTLNHLIRSDEASVEASRQDVAATRHEIAFRTAEAYIRLLQARAAKQIADSGVKLLTAQLDRARILQEGGVLERVDVMRLEAAVSSARLRSLTAERANRTVQAGLALILGLPTNTAIAASDTFSSAPKPPPPTTRDAIENASAHRPDLLASRARVRQARHGARAARSEILPSIAAIGTYQHNEGSGTLQPSDAWFVGLTLHWNVWDWGSTWNRYKEADARADQAQLGADRQRDQMTLEVETAALDAQTAHEAIGAATTGLTAAEEAFRITSERYSEGKGTTTDLLDAETEVTRARLAHTTARFEYFVALAALARAAGQMPDAYLSGI